MEIKKKCEHRSFQLGKGIWICQWCNKQFFAEEVERIMIERRQGFDSNAESVVFKGYTSTRSDLKQ